MNGEVLLTWLKNNVFHKMQQINRKWVIVLDTAKYHDMLTDDTRPPLSSSSK